MLDKLKALFTSKKFICTVVGILLVIAGKVGIGITEDQMWAIVALIASFVTGQGLADFGKEKAKIENGS